MFNSQDNANCRTSVTDHYKSALGSFNRLKENNAKLNESYNEILARQIKYDEQLASNSDFEKWTISDWDKSYQYKEGGAVPGWTDQLKELWSKNLTKPSEFDLPIGVLV